MAARQESAPLNVRSLAHVPAWLKGSVGGLCREGSRGQTKSKRGLLAWAWTAGAQEKNSRQAYNELRSCANTPFCQRTQTQCSPGGQFMHEAADSKRGCRRHRQCNVPPRTAMCIAAVLAFNPWLLLLARLLL